MSAQGGQGVSTIREPVLETPRLRLRPVEVSDAESIQVAAGRREIADTMISLPHPYPPGEARRYVEHLRAEREAGRAVCFVVEHSEGGSFLGLAEVRAIDREHSQAEVSFWIETGAQGRGFMTEALRAVVGYGFGELGLNRLYAYHMVRNPSSGRVLENIGFVQEGLLRERVRKWGKFEDVVLRAILKQDWRNTDNR